eukprot:Selendium_serpulae@DN5974_c0_g1_i2.p10
MECWLSSRRSIGRIKYGSSTTLCDGALTKRLLDPSCHVEREYGATMVNKLNMWRIRDLKKMTDVSTGANLIQILDWSSHSFRLVVHQGRHRIVRKLLAS